MTAGIALGLMLSLVLCVGAAFAEGWGYDLAGELMSPFCPGRTLSSCPSPQAAELVQWIVTQEAAGATKEDVLAILVERHGEEILGAPPAKGITLWAYIFPVAGFLLLGGVAFWVLRNIVGGGRAPEVATASPTAAALSAEGSSISAEGSFISAEGSSVSAEGSSPAEGGAAAMMPESDAELAAIVDAEIARRA